MVIVYIAAGLLIGLVVFQMRHRHANKTQQRVLAEATAAGVALDESGNISASTTLANLLAREEISGEKLTGKQAVFRDLLRLITEGPASIEEIRYLIRAGYEPLVRPDGKVYVPCAENEHLYMAGELPLAEADLEPCTSIE